MSDPVKRRYDASGRRAAAQATLRRICAAAETLFVRDGYARTSIRAVAHEAGVAEATVYLAFSTKAALLDATILGATRASPGEPLSAILEGPPARMLVRLAVSHAATLHRAAGLIALGESALLMDAALQPARERAHANLRAAYAAVAERLAHAGLLRSGLTAAEAADTLYAICNETTYLRLTDSGAQPPERYAAWLTTTLTATVLIPDDAGPS
jgi:AcrR family transcriptional regulator